MASPAPLLGFCTHSAHVVLTKEDISDMETSYEVSRRELVQIPIEEHRFRIQARNYREGGASNLRLYPTCERLLSGFGKDGGSRYSGCRGSNGDGPGRCRERIELAGGSGAVGDYRVGVREGAPGATVGKGDAAARNRISVLVGDFNGKGLGQLRSRRSGLIIAAGDRDIGSGASNGILEKSDVLEACRTGRDGDGGRAVG